MGVCKCILQENFLLVSRQSCLSLGPQNWEGGGDFFFLLTEGLAKLCLTLNALFLPKKVTDYWGELRETEAAAWNKDMEVLIKILYFY